MGQFFFTCEWKAELRVYIPTKAMKQEGAVFVPAMNAKRLVHRTIPSLFACLHSSITSLRIGNSFQLFLRDIFIFLRMSDKSSEKKTVVYI